MRPSADRQVRKGRPVPTPSETEILAGSMLGPDEDAPPLPDSGRGLRAALEEVLAQALTRPPCVVSFSGGRDSSAVLALACAVARRHGLELPFPVIMRFQDAPASDETGWQHLVLEHLKLDQFEVLNLSAELDALGPLGADCLRAHGVRWPANFYLHAPILRLARQGTLVTGIGGDELFESTASALSLRQLARASLPVRARARVIRARRPLEGYRWLNDTGRRRVAAALAREDAREPRRWDAALSAWYASRAFASLNGSISLLASSFDATVVNPLLDASVLAELRRAGGAIGFPSRAAAMDLLCGDLLPRSVLGRSTKATFGAAVWGPATRCFGAAWDGAGFAGGYLDVNGLHAEVAAPEPDIRTLSLLQAAWLGARSGVETHDRDAAC